MQINIIKSLEERGFIQDKTSDAVYEACEKPITLYCGFDPTGDSLHVGHLVPLMGLAHFQRAGHKVVCLAGGATGMIGDPSGKSEERNLLSEEDVRANVKKIEKNFHLVLEGETTLFLNNADWYSTYDVIHFLRNIGRNFRMGPMLGKESVRQRLNSDDGMSFTEFCYQVLQGYDFLYLYKNHGVTLELGGQDQWGNITAGVELVRKSEGKEVFGLTFPLLTRSDGKKFGKTEEGAVWLSADKTSPYDFYQYFYRIPDADVIHMMKMLTFMDLGEIKKIENEMANSPNSAQKRLAEEMTRLIHGEEGLKTAKQATEVAKPGANTVLNAASLEALSGDIPFYPVNMSHLVGNKLIDLLVELHVQNSKGEVRRLVKNGGLYLNNEKITDAETMIDTKDLIDGKLLLVAIGKKKKVVISAKLDNIS